jgi:hypothetical protein
LVAVRRRLLRPGLLLAPTLLLALAWLVPCLAQQIHRNAFESNRTFWIKGSADVACEEMAHAPSDQVAHEGQQSEHIQIKAGQGSSVQYYYPTAQAPISDEFSASLWLKANRPGLQLMARVVLPKEADPNSLQDRLTTLIRGDVYRKVGGWQRLEIGRPIQLCKEQQMYMQKQFGRSVDFTDAYVDRLVLNVYGGQGETDVWIDELEIGPVLDRPAGPAPGQPVAKSGPPQAAVGAPTGGSLRAVEFNGSNLTIDGKRFFFRGIRHTDTPLRALRDAGFNTLFVDYPWDAALLKQAVDLGFWLAPSLPVASEDARFVSSENTAKEIRTFPESEAVLFWNLGTALGAEQTALVTRSAQFVSAADRQHALGADAWDGLARYASSINLLSFHRWPLMTTLELTAYRDWLTMRARLAENPGTFLWTWIQTHAPDHYTQVVFNKDSTAGFSEPIGPQPEQIRLLTYLAVGSGFRGLGYWSDRFLANTHQGKDRLLTVALLNQEMEFLEPLLSCAESSTTWIDTSDPNVKAAVIWTQHGILVLPMWLGSSAQIVPGQAAVSKLHIKIPQIPKCFQCWEVTPGEVRSLHPDRPPGGVEIVLPEFGLTTAIVFTSDAKLVQYFQELCWARRQLAAQYTYDLAVAELEKVQRVEELLERDGHTILDGQMLLKDARERLAAAKGLWQNHQFGAAYGEAQRALRPARILMRAQWEEAIKGLDSPVSSPYAVSFYTLPQHWDFMRQLRPTTPGTNLLQSGDFEVVPGRAQEAWYPQESTLDDVVLKAERVAQIPITPAKAGDPAVLTPKEGRQFLLLQVQPKTKDPKLVPKALERTYLAINSPAVRLTPGSLVRISGWVAVPEPIQASVDGALLFDSAGGEPLAVRLTAPTGWKKVTLFRRVPASGTISLTVAMTGIGRVAFDDLRIEPMVSGPPVVNTAARQ